MTDALVQVHIKWCHCQHTAVICLCSLLLSSVV